jgi:Spy/CpxP family protein refolding chaperone
MMVSRAKMQNEIYSVLTGEQKELSEKLEMMARDDGEGGRRGSMHGGGMMAADAPSCR